jgi:ATP-dependent Clp protease protease subunit
MVKVMGEIYQPIDNIYNEMLVQDALKNRKLHLNEGVDEISMFKIMYYMDKIKKSDDSQSIEIKNRQPIEIVCNSYGGQLYECMALISKIEKFIEDGYKIITTLTGKAMSCGQLIFMFGSHRRIFRYGTLLIHKLSNWNVGNYDQLKVGYEEDKRLQDLLNGLIVKKTEISLDLLLEKTKGVDWYLSPEDCVKYKIADEII